MKFCYLDESGMGDEAILIMAGIIVDAQRMHQTKAAWSDFLDSLSSGIGRRVNEFHSSQFYRGSGPWNKIDGSERADIISAILNWVENRKHHITYSAIEKELFEKRKKVFKWVSKPWNAAAVHCILGLQKYHQQQNKNKGHTVLVLDRAKGEKGLAKLVLEPPEWVNSFYNKKSKDNPLNQIIDVPFFADSEHALLIQVADMISYILRTYAELEEGIIEEKYKGEHKQIKNWFKLITKRLIPQSMRYPSKARCYASQCFWDVAPECLRR
ncbi:MAG: DUF3800 domain-containing protein [Desulfobacteraceae bacterium]|jgi:hypothetical protein